MSFFLLFLKSLFEKLVFSEMSLKLCILQTIVPEQFLHHAGSSLAMPMLNARERVIHLLAVTSEVSSAYPGSSGFGKPPKVMFNLPSNLEKRLIFVFT